MGTNTAIGGGGFHHVAVRAHDFDASVRFYSDVLGFAEKITWGEGDDRAIMLDTGDGNYLEIFAGGEPGHKPEGAILHFAIRTDDCVAAMDRAKAAGVKVKMEPKQLDIPSRGQPTPVHIAFFHGPDGEVIELFENATT